MTLIGALLLNLWSQIFVSYILLYYPLTTHLCCIECAGIDFKLKTFTVRGKRVRLQIWLVSFIFTIRQWLEHDWST